MNRVHPLNINDDNVQSYTDSPPPYTPYVVQAEILNPYICRVQINDDIIKIKIINIEEVDVYEYVITKESDFWIKHHMCFQDNYENFKELMKMKFIENMNIFAYEIDLDNDYIKLRLYYKNFIGSFDITIHIEKNIHVNSHEDENEMIVKEFIQEQHMLSCGGLNKF